MALSPGVMFGPYQIVRALGAGAFGAVYEATRRPLGKRVAVKVLHPNMAQHPEMNARFLQEAQATAALEHPHIVGVFDVGIEGGAPFLVMEYLEGETLTARMRREGALPVTSAVDLMLPVLSAVAATHAAGIVHRDLKPGNLMLSVPRPGVVHPMLLDFGIAKVGGADGDGGLTRTSALLGTPQYMSPEQAKESRAIDARSDQFALGVILYECLSGRRLFKGDSMFEVLHQVVHAPIAPIAALRGDVPPTLDRAVLRSLERDPAQRFPSVSDLGRALLPFASEAARGQWREEFGGGPFEVTRVARSPAAPTAPTLPIASAFSHAPTELWLAPGTVTMTTQEVPAPTRHVTRPSRWPWVVGLLGAAVAAALTAGGLATLHRTPAPSGDAPGTPARLAAPAEARRPAAHASLHAADAAAPQPASTVATSRRSPAVVAPEPAPAIAPRPNAVPARSQPRRRAAPRRYPGGPTYGVPGPGAGTRGVGII